MQKKLAEWKSCNAMSWHDIERWKETTSEQEEKGRMGSGKRGERSRAPRARLKTNQLDRGGQGQGGDGQAWHQGRQKKGCGKGRRHRDSNGGQTAHGATLLYLGQRNAHGRRGYPREALRGRKVEGLDHQIGQVKARNHERDATLVVGELHT